MLISVVNLSKTIAAGDAERAIRAVNRQLAEDFASYWHLRASLRLDIGSPRVAHGRGPFAGDAVLYLDDDPKNTGVDGYHQELGGGRPFGVVYTQIATKLDGTWTPTLSHEAIELLVDPTVNTLVSGPHPVERTRHVFHWLEACDPVQADTYAIDGVRVSSFVLPAYFDPSSHEALRIDFLGTSRGGRPFGPFGIAPGGYVTFSDPEHGRNESIDADQEAKRRRRLKEAVGERRRGARREACLPKSAAARAQSAVTKAKKRR